MRKNTANLVHLAIIMDGNGRWAQKKGLLRVLGHEKGVIAVRESLEFCVENNIKYLTLYAFSTENWNRPPHEVNKLMELLEKFLKKEAEMLARNNIRLNVIGDLIKLPPSVFKTLQHTIAKLNDNTGVTLTLAIGYGGREELQRAVVNIAKKVKFEEISIENIDENTIKKHLYTYDLPDVDLLIRSSGEYRISNFLLWQIAYAELYFTEVLWPDFRKEHLKEAVENYRKRERRFGKISEQLT